jgi:hypothetical protein
MGFKGRNKREQQKAAYAKGFRIRGSNNLLKQCVPGKEMQMKYPSYDAAYEAGIGRWGSGALDAKMGWFISEEGSDKPSDGRRRRTDTTSPRALNPVFMDVPIKKKGFPDAVRVEMEDNGKVVASLNILGVGKDSLHLSGWKAKVKGQQYGRQLLEQIIAEHPHLLVITTDGFTEKGFENAKKAAESKGFRVTHWAHGTHAGYGIMAKQSYIDQALDSGHRTIIAFSPEMHSNYKDETTAQ